MPIVAPAVPVVGVALLLGSLWKKIADVDGRGADELAIKRAAFEKALREQLDQVRTKLFAEYDSIKADFSRTGSCMAGPLLAEAQAQFDLLAIQERVAQRVLQAALRFVADSRS